MICPGCGFINTDSDRFCGECGTILDDFRTEGRKIAGGFVVQTILTSNPFSRMYIVTDDDGNRFRLKEILVSRLNSKPEKINIDNLKTVISALQKVLFKDEKLYLVFSDSQIVTIADIIQGSSFPVFSRQEVLEWLLFFMDLLEKKSQNSELLPCGDLSAHSFGIDEKSRLVFYDPGEGFLTRNVEPLLAVLKPGFAAPEIFIQNRKCQVSDLFSIGAILYYMITGDNPELEREPYAFDKLHVAEERISASFATLLETMLEKRPEDRTENIPDFIKDVKIEFDPDNPAKLNLTSGISAYNLKHYKKAIQEFTSALLYHKNFELAYYWRGMSYLKQNKLEKAHKDFSRTIELKPGYLMAYYQRGICRFYMEMDEKALEDFNMVLNRKDDVLALMGKAMVLKGMDRLKEALGVYNKVLKIEQDHSQALLWRGLTKFELGRYKAALKDYNRVLELEPDNNHAYMARGLVKKELGMTTEALLDMDRAVELDSDNAEVFLERAIILISEKLYKTALLDLNRSIKLDKENPEAFFQRGKIKNRLGNYEKSIKDLDRAINLEPDFAEAYRVRSDSRRRLGMLKEARADEKLYQMLAYK